eukprot:Hpha_TRINITY_DN15065_c5_g10::TRINITY_DN15065_c5_g10_i1::g.125143::m.125143/K10394/KIF3A; kinesin family member 3A
MDQDRDKRIKVAVRCRPLHPVKERYDHKCVSRIDETSLVMAKAAGEGEEGKADTANFSFDYFFDETEQQIDIYNESVLDVVDVTLDGHNSTIFAYGQTGSGKTFTTLGKVEEEGKSLLSPNSGIFLRVLTDFFLYKERCESTMHVTVLLSIVEIYNDEIRDLLNKKNVLSVREVGDDVQMPDLRQEIVCDLHSVYKFFKIADAHRSVTATKMNDASSRSHAVFIIDLIQQARTPATPDPPSAETISAAIANDQKVLKGENPLQKARICIVDLAGSERVKKSGVEGKAFKEATEINKSLLALRNVIKGLYDGAKVLNFRDSKLTRILRSCFSDPNCKVLLCANISPTVKSFSETKSTLTFANQVKGIKAQAVSVDPAAELEYLKHFQRLEALTGDLRIATVMHDFVLQDPTGLLAHEATDEASRKALTSHIAEKYRSGIAIRIKQKEEEEARQVQVLVKELTETRLKELASARQQIEASIVKEKALQGQLAQELQQTKAGKEREVLEKKEKTETLKAERRETMEAVTHLERENQELREQLKDAAAEAIGGGSSGVDDAEVRRVVSQELERQKKFESHHQDSNSFAARIVQLRKLQEDHWRNREALIPGHEKRSALEAFLAKGSLARPYCEDIVGWIADRAARISQKRAAHGDGETFEHLSKVLSFEAHGPLHVTPGAFTDRSELPGSAIAEEPNPDDYEDEDDGPLHSQKDARELAARFLGVTPSAVSGAQPSASEPGIAGLARGVNADPVETSFRFDLKSARKQDEASGRAKMEAAEKQRREKAALQIRTHVSTSLRKPKPAGPPARADATYLQAIYDAHGLSCTASIDADVLRFMQRGGYLVKHGRSGQPRKRRFWLSRCNNRLYWTNDTRVQGRRCSVALRSVIGIVLGQHSAVFRASRPTPQTPGYSESFTLLFRQGDTLDLVAETTADFEAWTLGLAAITGFEPVWGTPLDDALLVKARREVTQKLDELVKSQDQHNGDLMKVFDQLGGAHTPGTETRQDASQDALFLSKGELRQLLGVDIYRATEVWKRLEYDGLVYDPHSCDQRFRSQSSTDGL